MTTMSAGLGTVQVSAAPGEPDQAGERSTLALGIDIGGTGIKGALVDVAAGTLVGERRYMPTPQPPTPAAIAEAVREMRDLVGVPEGTPVGVAFPAIVRHGVVRNATNIDASWIGTNAADLFSSALGCPVTVLNDADAAGLAEMSLGAGRDAAGVTLVVTLGTGIGSALFLDGRLLPNTEFGHLSINGIDCCPWASAAARVREGLSWAQWISRLQDYLGFAEFLMWPDLIIIGGGISHDAEQFLPLLQLDAPVVRAVLENDAGVIGAACEALEVVGAH
ncbi:MAG TPA: ROK family protein [Propionibacteriaceae bacterium]|nr:ROK family protein [Propionibacteriaceae bacterium]